MSNRAARRHPDRRPPRIGAPNSVAIGYVRPNDVDGRFFDSITNLLLYDRDNGHRIDCTVGAESGPRIANSRNEVVRMFLETTDCEWLYWTDTDMVMPVDTIDVLLEHADPVERPIVGALCFAGGRTKMSPTIYAIGHNADGKLESETILAYPQAALIEVGGTGCACVLVHRTVFERIQANMPDGYPLPWYQDQIIDNKDWGEDLIFCVRARAAGARIFIHTGVKVGHRKMWTMDEPAFLDYAARLDAAAAEAGYDENDRLTADKLPDLAIAR